MSAHWEGQARELVADLERVFSTRLQSVNVYGRALDGDGKGPLQSLVLVSSLTQDDLDACARLASEWARDGVEIPLILPREEFRRSLDSFPLEYSRILSAHTRVFGVEAFSDVVIAREDVRRECEKQAKSHLLHLREGYLEAHGNPSSIARLVMASAPGFVDLLGNVAALIGAPRGTRVENARAGAAALGLEEQVVTRITALDVGGTNPTADGARLFPDYLATVERLAQAVDAWHP